MFRKTAQEQKNTMPNVPAPEPWYNEDAAPEQSDLPLANQTDAAKEQAPQEDAEAQTPSDLQSDVFANGVDTDLQDQVVQIANVAKSIASSVYQMELDQAAIMRIAKDALKNISKAVSDEAVQPLVDQIDSYLEKSKDKDSTKKEPSKQQESKAAPPWQEGGATPPPVSPQAPATPQAAPGQ